VIRLRFIGSWWAVIAYCTCGAVSRATAASTLEAAVSKFRYERRVLWSVTA
jgi:hypothetical protein